MINIKMGKWCIAFSCSITSYVVRSPIDRFVSPPQFAVCWRNEYRDVRPKQSIDIFTRHEQAGRNT